MEPLAPAPPTSSEARAVGVVIPTLNEVASIGFVIGELPPDLIAAIVVADSGSTDGTQAAAEAAGARVLDTGRGYGRACALGAAALPPECRVVLFLDGDGADRADLAARLARPVLEGTHDFVLATREDRALREPGAMLWHQVLAGRLAGLGMGLLTGTRYTDMCAFRAIDRTCLASLGMTEMTYGWNIEMQLRAGRAGLRVLEIALPYRRRRGGTSKVAGSLRGTIRAGTRIVATFLRVAAVGPRKRA